MSFRGKLAIAAALGGAALSGATSFAGPAAPRAMEAVQLRADPAVEVRPPPAAPGSRVQPGDIDRELACLARVILYEAGNESRTGQLAVAQVVMNRVRSGRFPSTICGVVLQRGQFSNIRSFQPRRDARWRRAVAIARDARAGSTAPVIGNALFFHAARARSAFSRRARVGRIGNHVFYR